MNAKTNLTTLLIAVCPMGMVFGQQAPRNPTWRNITGNWPDTSNQVRAMMSSKGELYIGLSGTVGGSAQVWKRTDSGWVKLAEFESLKVAVLQADAAGNLYVGTGTPHSAETPGMGQAEVWRIDRAGRKSRLRAFASKDVAYCMVWFGGKLHVGTMTEDRPGKGEIWRFDDPGWRQVAGPGIKGWPAPNTYAAVYEMWVHDGALIAGTFSRTAGDGDVLRLAGNRWVELHAPASIIALSFETYREELVTALSNVGGMYANPIHVLQPDGTWQPLGRAPAKWKGAYIPNHMVVSGDDLYLGIGGARGTLSVWKYDGVSWTMLGGDSLNGSWSDPLVSQGAEWVYRLALHRGKLFAGLASDRAPFQAQVWEMTP